MFSLIIGSVLGLTQFRIKRLLAYSTISHIGFILLALSIGTTESIQAYIFYILQYTISNLNIFIILVSIGYSLYMYTYKGKKDKLVDQNNSPVQLINQIKGYFHVNPFITISLSITLFSFVGIPPIVGFFAKQMILSAALDNGYIFMSIIAILTSVIAAGYYLALIKNMFFYKSTYNRNTVNTEFITNSDSSLKQKTIMFNTELISVNSSLSISISILTLLLLLFIYVPTQ
jgi:NADH-ubiquinone oxidoreductase chain 2